MCLHISVNFDEQKFFSNFGPNRHSIVILLYDEETRSDRSINFTNLKCKCHARFRGVCVVAEFLLLPRELKPVVHGTQGLCKVKNKCNEAVSRLTQIVAYLIRRALPLNATSFCGGLS